MAAHFEPSLYLKVTAKFIDDARRVAVDFGVAQPLTLTELRTDTAHDIRQLSRHTCNSASRTATGYYVWPRTSKRS